MEGNLLESLKLMVVGLTTVFAVLLLIIGVGNALISLANKFLPAEEVAAGKQSSQKSASAVDSKVQQAIAKAVEQLTAGKGRVEKIEKL